MWTCISQERAKEEVGMPMLCAWLQAALDMINENQDVGEGMWLYLFFGYTMFTYWMEKDENFIFDIVGCGENNVLVQTMREQIRGWYGSKLLSPDEFWNEIIPKNVLGIIS